MSEALHTKTTGGLRLLPGIDLTASSLPGRLAGKMSEQLELFAAEMRHGRLASPVAIGLEVMGELVEVEVTEPAGPKGRHDPGRAVDRHGSERGSDVGRTAGVGAPAPDHMINQEAATNFHHERVNLVFAPTQTVIGSADLSVNAGYAEERRWRSRSSRNFRVAVDVDG